MEVAAEQAGHTSSESTLVRILSSPAGRNAGLVIALVILIIVGIVTAGDRFASTNNMLTILRLASVIGVVSIGMTFVITGGGIDLSVGAIVALASVWATTLATQTMAADTHWSVMVFVALAVGAGCGLVNGVLIAYGRIAPFIATLAMLAAARGLAEIIAKRRTQIVTVREFVDFFGASVVGVPVLVIIFALVSIGGWVLLNRTTFGRRTLAVGGNIEAARLAGINVRRHTALLYVLLGVACGIAAVMLIARTTTGQLDARTAVRAGRDRRRRHRRHAAQRRPRNHRRDGARRPHLHDAHQRLHAQQPRHLQPGRCQGRDHHRRGPAPAAGHRQEHGSMTRAGAAMPPRPLPIDRFSAPESPAPQPVPATARVHTPRSSSCPCVPLARFGGFS